MRLSLWLVGLAWWGLVPALLFLAGCVAPTGASPQAEPLVILAAADLQFALPEIEKRYQAVQGHPITIALGSTGILAAQIEHGAPADLFFAADQSFLDRLDGQGLLLPESRRAYAVGRLALAAARHVAFPPKTLEDLLRPEVKKVAIANPEHAPYGRAAKQALEARGLWERLVPKIVLGENVAQALQFVQTGNADAGIVARSVIPGAPGVSFTLVEAALHAPLVQEAAALKSSKQPEAARGFLAFVTGPEGRAILEGSGFALPEEP